MACIELPEDLMSYTRNAIAGADDANPDKKIFQTYSEAVAQEKTAWGDSWSKDSHPVPTCCIAWKIEMIDLLRPVMLGSDWHRRILSKKCDSAETERRAGNGDRVRDMLIGWYGLDWSNRIGRRGLSLLVACNLLPRPDRQIIREWLDGAGESDKRGPIDHDERMRQAEGTFDVGEA